MTTPAGVPNLPIGALTVETLASQLQDLSAEAMYARAGERVPSIFAASTGGDILNNLSPFGILTNIWAGINSLIANSDPGDIQGPEDLPPLLLDFIENLPVIGQFVKILEALLGNYDGTDETLLGIQDLLSPIVEFFTGVIETAGSIGDWAASLISGGLSTVMQTLETFLTGIPNLSTWLATFKTWIDGLLNISNLSTFLETFKTLVTGLLGITNFSNWVAVFKSVVDTFSGLFGSLGSTVWTVLNNAITTLSALVGTFGSTIWTVINDVLAFFANITSRGAWLNVLKSATDTFKALFDSLGSTVWTVLTEIVQHFVGVFTGAGSVGTWLSSINANLLSVIGTLTGKTISSLADGISKLTQFTQGVPSLESLIQGIMGDKKNPLGNPGNTTLRDLAWWASQLLFSTSVVPSFNLYGAIPAELLALIGVGNIGNVAPNLITDAGFGSEAALQAGVGWTWDSGINSTGSSGGAAKLLCDGGVKYMFSNLIAAAPKQKLTISVKTRYTKGTSAQANIIAAVRTYQGATVKSTDTVASLTATGVTSVGTSGADTAGFKTMTGTYTVPDNVDTVRLVLGVTTGTSGTTVWFDDASLAKTSLLPQDLVSNLGNTLEALLPLDQFNELLDSVADQTGATIQQVKDVLDGKLTSDSQLNGSKVTIGNISAEVIEELRQTWEKLGGSVQGFTGTAPTTIAGVAAEFASLVSNITSLSSLIGGNSSDIFRLGSTVSGHTGLIGGLDSQLQSYASSITTKFNKLSDDNTKAATSAKTKLDEYETRIWNLEHPTVTPKPVTTGETPYVPPPVPPPTPPTPAPAPVVSVSVRDEFERVSLGSAWTLTPFQSNGSNVDILNAHDAYMATPTASLVENRIAAIYTGAGSASVGEYQKVYATLTTKAGTPLVGTPGYNDLIGRAASALQCLFCRFYPTGRVQFGYRNGSWTETMIGDFQLGYGKNPTGGTSIEFYVGDKAISDQTRVYAKVGTSTVGPAYVPANVLATMGKGWGFLMGHGLSAGNLTFGYGAPQVPGTLNFWAAQEQ